MNQTKPLEFQCVKTLLTTGYSLQDITTPTNTDTSRTQAGKENTEHSRITYLPDTTPICERCNIHVPSTVAEYPVLPLMSPLSTKNTLFTSFVTDNFIQLLFWLPSSRISSPSLFTSSSCVISILLSWHFLPPSKFLDNPITNSFHACGLFSMVVNTAVLSHTVTLTTSPLSDLY